MAVHTYNPMALGAWRQNQKFMVTLRLYIKLKASLGYMKTCLKLRTCSQGHRLGDSTMVTLSRWAAPGVSNAKEQRAPVLYFAPLSRVGTSRRGSLEDLSTRHTLPTFVFSLFVIGGKEITSPSASTRQG